MGAYPQLGGISSGSPKLWIRPRKTAWKYAGTEGIPIISYNENLSEEALLNRGYDRNGTPYAPCGRLCCSKGYDYDSESRQYVCGPACPPDERKNALTAAKREEIPRMIQARQIWMLAGLHIPWNKKTWVSLNPPFTKVEF